MYMYIYMGTVTDGPEELEDREKGLRATRVLPHLFPAPAELREIKE